MSLCKPCVFEGVATALITPFENDQIDYSTLGKLIDIQLQANISAILVAGTTGESSTLHLEEHQELIRFAKNRIGGRVPLIAGCGSNATTHAIKLAKSACEAGADALLAVTPYYNKASDRGIVLHYQALADEAEKPLILYNVPSRTGFHLTMEHYRALSKHPNIVGVKEASGDLELLETLIAECGDDLDIYTGNDSQTVAAMRLGAKGVISVYSNLEPQTVLELYRKCESGDHAGAEKLRCEHLDRMRALFLEINPIPVKYLLAQRGLCKPEYRLPLCPPSERTCEKLKNTF